MTKKNNNYPFDFVLCVAFVLPLCSENIIKLLNVTQEMIVGNKFSAMIYRQLKSINVWNFYSIDSFPVANNNEQNQEKRTCHNETLAQDSTKSKTYETVLSN